MVDKNLPHLPAKKQEALTKGIQQPCCEGAGWADSAPPHQYTEEPHLQAPQRQIKKTWSRRAINLSLLVLAEPLKPQGKVVLATVAVEQTWQRPWAQFVKTPDALQLCDQNRSILHAWVEKNNQKLLGRRKKVFRTTKDTDTSSGSGSLRVRDL